MSVIFPGFSSAEEAMLNLPGRIFLIQRAGGRESQIASMLATGRGYKVFDTKFDSVRSLEAYQSLNMINILNISCDNDRNGYFNIQLLTDSSGGVSVGGVSKSVPNNFDISFSVPYYDVINGAAVLRQGVRRYPTRISFSPDGKMIAGLMAVPDAVTKLDEMRLCVVPSDGSSSEVCNVSLKVCETNSPVWSPDGKKIAITGALKGDLGGGV